MGLTAFRLREKGEKSSAPVAQSRLISRADHQRILQEQSVRYEQELSAVRKRVVELEGLLESATAPTKVAPVAPPVAKVEEAEPEAEETEAKTSTSSSLRKSKKQRGK